MQSLHQSTTTALASNAYFLECHVNVPSSRNDDLAFACSKGALEGPMEMEDDLCETCWISVSPQTSDDDERDHVH